MLDGGAVTPNDVYDRYQKEWSDVQDHLALLRQESHGSVVEIGVRTGISTAALLCGVQENYGHLYSIDVDDCPVYKSHPQWTFIHANSVEDSERILDMLPWSFDLVFVDGDHSYTGCLSDLRNYGSKSKVIMVHDTDCPNTYPGVRQAVVDFLKTYRTWKVQWINKSHGMAVLRRES